VDWRPRRRKTASVGSNKSPGGEVNGRSKSRTRGPKEPPRDRVRKRQQGGVTSKTYALPEHARRSAHREPTSSKKGKEIGSGETPGHATTGFRKTDKKREGKRLAPAETKEGGTLDTPK